MDATTVTTAAANDVFTVTDPIGFQMGDSRSKGIQISLTRTSNTPLHVLPRGCL
jgi:hypothetical protein